MRTPLARLAHFGLAAALAVAGFAAAAQTAVRPPLLRVADAKQPVTLQKLAIDAEVVGTLARTRVELTLHNPNDRILEGELQFPLLEGQTVTGFALDIGGRLRAAVPVEKAKGRQVFEEIVRRNTDPALLEKTQGNNFKLRVYPLPARGDRRVVLLLTESLAAGTDGKLAYRPPPNFGNPAADTHLNLRVAGIEAAALHPSASLQTASLRRDGGDAVLEWQRGAAKGDSAKLYEVAWAAPRPPSVRTDRFEGTDYFYAEVPVAYPSAPRTPPRDLVIVWDASGSGANRDHARELAMLDAYLKRVPEVAVTLILARNEADPQPQRLSVAGGRWQELRSTLEKVRYDGATNPAAWKIPAGLAADKTLALLFSDGLANWGDAPAPHAQVPLYAVNAAASADPERLRALAEDSGGSYIDLLRLAPEAAAAELGVRHARLVGLGGRGVAQLVSASARPEGGRLFVAGQLTESFGELVLTLETPKGGREERRLAIQAGRTASSKPVDSLTDAPSALFPGLAAQRWAAFTLAGLVAERSQHRAEIRRIGQRFGLVTEETSLIVLDTLEDYLRYEIAPPAGDLRTEYEQRQSQLAAARQRSRGDQLEDVVRRYAQRAQWWEKDFPKGEPPKPSADKEASSLGEPRLRMASPVAAAPSGGSNVSLYGVADAAFEARSPTVARAASPAPAKPDAGTAGKAPASIQLQKWQPDAPYAKRLREASADEAYGIYLDERPDHLDSTAFFLDAAEIFFDKGRTDTAIRILSNLAEMNLENRAILRILAYRLQQAGAVKLALPFLKRVKELAPDEPQSWRDLGLAYAEDGQPQAAIDQLWEVVAMPSQGRFTDIDLIALAELNAVVARTPGLDTSRIDPRLLRNLPLDLRAVLTWDADNTDIDLWVIDPNGEKAYYAHPLTYQGGHMSRDFTAGYGPEEFALKTAKPGRYEVRAQFYGHRQQVVSPYTTLMLRLTTGFGTSEQQDKDVILRLSGQGQQVLVGSFEFGEKH